MFDVLRLWFCLLIWLLRSRQSLLIENLALRQQLVVFKRQRRRSPAQERAARAKVAITTQFSSKQQAFLEFVLAHYVGVGVGELDQEKLTPLLRLRYPNSISDAIADLGRPEEISKVFVGFQKYLYQLPA